MAAGDLITIYRWRCSVALAAYNILFFSVSSFNSLRNNLRRIENMYCHLRNGQPIHDIYQLGAT
jgi:hypothetical protein